MLRRSMSGLADPMHALCPDWQTPCAKQADVSHVIQLSTSGFPCSFIHPRLHFCSPWPSRTDHRHRERDGRPAPPTRSRSALWLWIASSWVGGLTLGGGRGRGERLEYGLPWIGRGAGEGMMGCCDCVFQEWRVASGSRHRITHTIKKGAH